MSSVTWLGHSSVVIEISGVRFVTDPVLGRRVAHLRRAAGVPRSALGRLDGVLVSHVHFDHLDLSSFAKLERSLPVVVPRGAGGILRRRGFERVTEAEAGDELQFEAARVDVTHAEHGVVRRYVRTSPALGFVIRGSSSVYFAGDTDLFEGMRDLRPVDVAILPIAGWGPRLPPGHLDARRAAEALRLLQPSIAVPVHWGTFRTPFAAAPDGEAGQAFLRTAAEVAPEVDVRVLQLGETLDL